MWDVLLVVTSDRYGTKHFGTVLRLVDAVLRGGNSVQVWACRLVNMLTECSPDAGCCAADQPAIARQIGDLLAAHPDRFSWVACRTCGDSRGAGAHIPGVLTEPSFANFRQYVDGAAKTIYIGGT